MGYAGGECYQKHWYFLYLFLVIQAPIGREGPCSKHFQPRAETNEREEDIERERREKRREKRIKRIKERREGDPFVRTTQNTKHKTSHFTPKPPKLNSNSIMSGRGKGGKGN